MATAWHVADSICSIVNEMSVSLSELVSRFVLFPLLKAFLLLSWSTGLKKKYQLSTVNNGCTTLSMQYDIYVPWIIKITTKQLLNSSILYTNILRATKESRTLMYHNRAIMPSGHSWRHQLHDRPFLSGSRQNFVVSGAITTKTAVE